MTTPAKHAAAIEARPAPRRGTAEPDHAASAIHVAIGAPETGRPTSDAGPRAASDHATDMGTEPGSGTEIDAGAEPDAAAEPESGREPETEASCRFDRARTARSTATLEDYTELISDLQAEQGEARTTEIARALGVAHPTANKAIARLKREGLVTARPYRGIFLTEAGQAMAERVRARHRTVVKLLLAIGVPPEAAEIDAEGMEHHVSAVTLEAFESFLKSGR